MPYLNSRGISSETASHFKLGYSGDTGNYATQNRLTIPYFSPLGPWHIKYRCLQSHDCKEAGCPKYTYDGGSRQHLYNSGALLDTQRVVLVEGELDAVAVTQTGAPAVAYPGAQVFAANPWWVYCFDSCDEIIIVADGDSAGVEAANKVERMMHSTLTCDLHVIVLPDDQDSNSMIVAEGQQDFLSRIGWI